MLKQVQIDWNEVQLSAIEYNWTAPTQNNTMPYQHSVRNSKTQKKIAEAIKINLINFFLSVEL